MTLLNIYDGVLTACNRYFFFRKKKLNHRYLTDYSILLWNISKKIKGKLTLYLLNDPWFRIKINYL